MVLSNVIVDVTIQVSHGTSTLAYVQTSPYTQATSTHDVLGTTLGALR